MLVEEKTFKDENGVIGYYESVYKSTNILQTTYFPQQHRLYVSFNRGGVYSYENISPELYDDFKNADSQGEFFAKDIKKHPELYPFRKEFTLYPEEVNQYKKVVEEFEEKEEQQVAGNEISMPDYPAVGIAASTDNCSLEDSDTIQFLIKNEPILIITKNGLFFKGEQIFDDDDIHDKMKLWLSAVSNTNSYKIASWVIDELKMFEQKETLTQFEAGQQYVLNVIKQWI